MINRNIEFGYGTVTKDALNKSLSEGGYIIDELTKYEIIIKRNCAEFDGTFVKIRAKRSVV